MNKSDSIQKLVKEVYFKKFNKELKWPSVEEVERFCLRLEKDSKLQEEVKEALAK